MQHRVIGIRRVSGGIRHPVIDRRIPAVERNREFVDHRCQPCRRICPRSLCFLRVVQIGQAVGIQAKHGIRLLRADVGRRFEQEFQPHRRLTVPAENNFRIAVQVALVDRRLHFCGRGLMLQPQRIRAVGTVVILADAEGACTRAAVGDIQIQLSACFIGECHCLFHID